MEVSPVRIGIVGLGFGAKVQLPAFQSLPGVAVRGVSARNYDRAKEIVAGSDGIRIFGDWLELIQSPEIDAVSVVTPPVMHSEIVLAALRSGKHVLCEKPFGLNLLEAREMVEASDKQPQLVTAVDFEFRFDPGLRDLRILLQAGKIGKLQSIDVSWLTSGRASPDVPWTWQNDNALGGGVANAFASHVLDYVAWMGESDFQSLVATKQILIPHRSDAAGRTRAVTAEDRFDGTGSLFNGIQFSFEISNCIINGSGHQIRVTGEKGMLILESKWPFDPSEAKLRFRKLNETDSQVIPLGPIGFSPLVESRFSSFRDLAEIFIASIATGRRSRDLPRFSDGLRAREALEQSASNG